MQTPFIIYIRAVGLYMLVTLPVIIAPFMYIISAIYVLLFGWFAWGLFTIFYLLLYPVKQYAIKMISLMIAVIISVGFAFQMIEVFGTERDVWNSGSFLLFPFAGVIAGWISLLMSWKQVQAGCVVMTDVVEFESEK